MTSPTSPAALPLTPAPSERPSLTRPTAPLRTLLVVAGSLVLFGVLLWATAHTLYWWSGPTLEGTRSLAESLAGWTTDPDALQAIRRLQDDEIYTYAELQAAAEILRAVEQDRVEREWLELAAFLLVWTALVLTGREASRWYRESRPGPVIASPMGVLDDGGTFVPHELPFPTCDRRTLASLDPQPEWVRTTVPRTPLAMALLECYAAHPNWPAQPAPAPEASGRGQRDHAGVRLVDHVLAVRTRALTLADAEGLPPHLVEQLALAHDVGKLVSYTREGTRYVRLHTAHDRMSALLLAGLPEWQTVPRDEQIDLGNAVACHHRPDSLPPTATPRARALLHLLAHADERTAFGESQSGAVSTTPPAGAPAPGHAPQSPAPAGSPPALASPTGPPPPVASPAPGPATAGAPTETPTPPISPADLETRLAQILSQILPTLRINDSPFDGQIDPAKGTVMLLNSAILAALLPHLTPADRAALSLPEDGDTQRLPKAKDLSPHPSSPIVGAAIRRLGWLVESWSRQASMLWCVKIGRITWPTCWLLDSKALPAAVVQAWSPSPWTMEILGPAHPVPAAVDPQPVPAHPSSAPAPPKPADDDPGYGGPPEVIEPILGDGLPDLPGEHEERIHDVLDDQ